MTCYISKTSSMFLLGVNITPGGLLVSHKTDFLNFATDKRKLEEPRLTPSSPKGSRVPLKVTKVIWPRSLITVSWLVQIERNDWNGFATIHQSCSFYFFTESVNDSRSSMKVCSIWFSILISYIFNSFLSRSMMLLWIHASFYDLVLSDLLHATGLFLYPLKASENLWIFDVFRWYREKTVAWNGLMMIP